MEISKTYKESFWEPVFTKGRERMQMPLCEAPFGQMPCVWPGVAGPAPRRGRLWPLKAGLHRQRKKDCAKESKAGLNQNLFRRPHFLSVWTEIPDSVLGISFPRLFSWLISRSPFDAPISFLKQLLLNNWFQAVSKGHRIHGSLFWLKPFYSNTGIPAPQPAFLRTLVWMLLKRQQKKGSFAKQRQRASRCHVQKQRRVAPIWFGAKETGHKRVDAAWARSCKVGKQAELVCSLTRVGVA